MHEAMFNKLKLERCQHRPNAYKTQETLLFIWGRNRTRTNVRSLVMINRRRGDFIKMREMAGRCFCAFLR